MGYPSRSKIFRSYMLERSAKSTNKVTYKCVTTVDPTNAKSIKQICKRLHDVGKDKH